MRRLTRSRPCSAACLQDEEGAANIEQHVESLLAKLLPSTCPGHLLPELARVASGGTAAAARWALWALARIVCSVGAAGSAYVRDVASALQERLERVVAHPAGVYRLVCLIVRCCCACQLICPGHVPNRTSAPFACVHLR